MNFQVYFPRDLAPDLNRGSENLLLLGIKKGFAFVCVKFVSEHTEIKPTNSPLGELEIIGVTGTAKTYNGYFHIGSGDNGLPVVRNIHTDGQRRSYTVISFTPPNYKNLEYFSIEPILLQSMGNYQVDATTNKLVGPYCESFLVEPLVTTFADQETLDTINLVLKIRTSLELLQDLEHFSIKLAMTPVKSVLFALLSNIILSIQLFTVLLINILNGRIMGISLVLVSQIFRQLDLRLKQITYFPIQFLCYYDKNILYKDNSSLLKELGLPVFNSNLNINNSNYINLYNSIWLIINDVLLGITAWNLIAEHWIRISTFVSEVIIQRVLFTEFYGLISWISYNHPAGFKLNNELGSFMGDLFLWSLKSFNYLILEHTTGSIKSQMMLVYLTKGLCYGGITFLIAFVIDMLRLMTVHILWFYQTSARIYQKQVEILKLLIQLFRGKKYNVLRNRVDNLDNYSKPRDFFEIDQLLLGTLLFMILVLLLPTVFAFYLTYFIIRLSVLLVMNFFENLLLIINFVPLFVILLKLKNSSRLQGGIQFELHTATSLKTSQNTYLTLSNKSLTYSEIFKNFAALFKQLKNFRTSIISSFFKGDLISLNHNHTLKFNYLLLPENVSKSIDIWNRFTHSV